MRLQNFTKFDLFITIYVGTLSSGPIVVLILEGDTVKLTVMGATDPKKAENTIRNCMAFLLIKIAWI